MQILHEQAYTITLEVRITQEGDEYGYDVIAPNGVVVESETGFMTQVEASAYASAYIGKLKGE